MAELLKQSGSKSAPAAARAENLAPETQGSDPVEAAPVESTPKPKAVAPPEPPSRSIRTGPLSAAAQGSSSAAPRVRIPVVPPDKKLRTIRVFNLHAKTGQPEGNAILINASDFDPEFHQCVDDQDQRHADTEMKAKRLIEDKEDMQRTIKRLARGT